MIKIKINSSNAYREVNGFIFYTLHIGNYVGEEKNLWISLVKKQYH